jgi:hypothetical protein
VSGEFAHLPRQRGGVSRALRRLQALRGIGQGFDGLLRGMSGRQRTGRDLRNVLLAICGRRSLDLRD